MVGEAAYSQYKVDQARHYLNAVADARRHIVALQRQADELREIAEGIRGMAYDVDRITTTPYADAIPDAVADLDELSRRAKESAAEYSEMVDTCSTALASLGGWQADLLRLRYLCGMTLTEIGELPEWSHDRKYMSVLHIQALDKFYEHMPHTWRDPRPSAI